MNYLFLYYTGTYNTRFLTEKIKEKLLRPGDRCTTVEIARDVPAVDTAGFDVIGLGFPIYGFNSPLPFNRYLARLRFAEGQKFFIYKDSGEAMAMNNAASRIPLRIMRKSRCTFLGEYHFLMPYNIHFPFSKKLICRLLEEDKKLLEVMACELRDGIVRKAATGPLLNAGAFAVSIQKAGGNFNSFFYRADPEKCVLCGLCARQCPEKNITIRDGKVTFGHNCDMCMRCSYFCPKQAISIGMLESWRVSDYYDLNALWDTPAPPAEECMDKSTPFYRSYQRIFREIDDAYCRIAEKDGAALH